VNLSLPRHRLTIVCGLRSVAIRRSEVVQLLSVVTPGAMVYLPLMLLYYPLVNDRDVLTVSQVRYLTANPYEAEV
jgi:hypothetical protein